MLKLQYVKINTIDDIKVGSIISGKNGYRMVLEIVGHEIYVSNNVPHSFVEPTPSAIASRPELRIRKYVYTMQDLKFFSYYKVTFVPWENSVFNQQNKKEA